MELPAVGIGDYFFLNRNYVSVVSLSYVCTLFWSIVTSENRIFAKCADFPIVQILCTFEEMEMCRFFEKTLTFLCRLVAAVVGTASY